VTEVVILCQGTQSRLGHQHGHKQLLTLPATGERILERTLAMARRVFSTGSRVTVIGWPEMFAKMQPAQPWETRVTLPDPGNSSLKGVARYLEARDRGEASPTAILLGDVVYSWQCMYAIRTMTLGWGFVGTKDISESTGEIWGVGWSAEHDDSMLANLRDALLRHPPFDDEYQPGQLRRWIAGWRKKPLVELVRHHRVHGHYVDIDDYTMDVDLPKHVPLLARASVLARAEDAAHAVG